MVLACFESRNLTKRAHHRIGRESDIGPLLKGDETEIGIEDLKLARKVAGRPSNSCSRFAEHWEKSIHPLLPPLHTVTTVSRRRSRIRAPSASHLDCRAPATEAMGGLGRKLDPLK